MNLSTQSTCTSINVPHKFSAYESLFNYYNIKCLNEKNFINENYCKIDLSDTNL